MVAAWVDRAEFSCAECQEDARQGGGLQEERSGAAGSCEGPKEYHPYRHHPGGGVLWTGCPRASVTPRTDALLAHYDRSGGRLTATEQRTAPWALFDAYGAISFVEGLRQWQAAQDAKAQAEQRGRG